MAAVAIGAVTAIAGIASSESAKASVKRESRRQERLERLMTAEEIRRLGKEQAQVMGSAKAQIAASGFTGFGASTEAYMNDLRMEQARELQFTEMVGASRATSIKRAGDARASSYGYQSMQSALAGIQAVGEGFNWGLKDTTAKVP